MEILSAVRMTALRFPPKIELDFGKRFIYIFDIIWNDGIHIETHQGVERSWNLKGKIMPYREVLELGLTDYIIEQALWNKAKTVYYQKHAGRRRIGKTFS